MKARLRISALLARVKKVGMINVSRKDELRVCKVVERLLKRKVIRGVD